MSKKPPGNLLSVFKQKSGAEARQTPLGLEEAEKREVVLFCPKRKFNFEFKARRRFTNLNLSEIY